jgi:hypothetical protein
MMGTSRGIRNNNPGNIRKGKDNWKGMAEKQTDAQFVQFRDMAYGYRALLILLKNYIEKRGCVTIRDIIRRWAPSVENDTEAYIRSVCEYMGVGEDYRMNAAHKLTMCALAAAISRHENGCEPVMDEVWEGWAMI